MNLGVQHLNYSKMKLGETNSPNSYPKAIVRAWII